MSGSASSPSCHRWAAASRSAIARLWLSGERTSRGAHPYHISASTAQEEVAEVFFVEFFLSLLAYEHLKVALDRSRREDGGREPGRSRPSEDTVRVRFVPHMYCCRVFEVFLLRRGW